MVTLVELSDNFKIVTSVGVLDLATALNLTLFNDEEVVTLVTLMEHIFIFVHFIDLEAVKQLNFLILLQILEEFDLVEVFKVDVATADRVHCDDLLKDISLEYPSVTVCDSSDGGSPLVVVEECDFSEANQFIILRLEHLLDCDMICEIGVVWIGTWLVHSDFNLTVCEGKVLRAHLTVLNDRLPLLKATIEHGFGKHLVVLRVRVLCQERSFEKGYEGLLTFFRLGEGWSDEIFEYLSCRIESLVED